MATRSATAADIIGSALLAWYDIADAATITQAAGKVSQVADKSVSSGARTGSPYHVTQATASKQFTYNATGLNGMPTLVGTNSARTFLGNTALATAQPFTLVAVAQRSGTYTGNEGLVSSNADYTAVYTKYFNSNPIGALYATNGNAPDENTPDPRLFMGVFNGSACNLYVDTNLGKYSPVSGTGVLNGLNIGGQNGGTENHDGYISEVLVISTAVTLDQRQKLEGYLAWKWGYQARLPANHPYKAAAPTVTTADPGAIRRRPLILMAS